MRRRSERQRTEDSVMRGALVLDGEGGLQGIFGFCFSRWERFDSMYVNELDILFA
jgi:hypothetical protein